MALQFVLVSFHRDFALRVPGDAAPRTYRAGETYTLKQGMAERVIAEGLALPVAASEPAQQECTGLDLPAATALVAELLTHVPAPVTDPADAPIEG